MFSKTKVIIRKYIAPKTIWHVIIYKIYIGVMSGFLMTNDLTIHSVQEKSKFTGSHNQQKLA